MNNIAHTLKLIREFDINTIHTFFSDFDLVFNDLNIFINNCADEPEFDYLKLKELLYQLIPELHNLSKEALSVLEFFRKEFESALPFREIITEEGYLVIKDKEQYLIARYYKYNNVPNFYTSLLKCNEIFKSYDAAIEYLKKNHSTDEEKTIIFYENKFDYSINNTILPCFKDEFEILFLRIEHYFTKLR